MVIINKEKSLSCDSNVAGKKEDYPQFDVAVKKVIELTNKNRKEYHFTFNDETKKLTSNIIEGCINSVNPCMNEDDALSITAHSHYDKEYECLPSPADMWEDFVEKDRPKMIIICPSAEEILTIENPHFDQKTKSFIKSLVTDTILSRKCIDMDEKRTKLIEEENNILFDDLIDKFKDNMRFEKIKDIKV